MYDPYAPDVSEYMQRLMGSASPTAMAAAQSPSSLASLLAQLDKLQRGKYDRPTAGAPAGALSTLNGIQGLQFVTNAGRGANVKANRSGFVPYLEGAEYRLVNQRKKQAGVVTEGAGEQGLFSVYDAARNLSSSQGKKAKWAVQMRDPATGQWTVVAQDRPKSKPLKVAGKIIGTALPIAVSLIPGLQFAGPVLSSTLAGGAGAALAGRDPLKGAIMGGLSSAGGQVIGGALQAGGGLGTNLAANAARAVGTGIGATAGGLVTGQNLKNSLLGGVTAGGLSYLGGELFGPGGSSTTGEPTNLLEGTPFDGAGSGFTVNTGGGGAPGGDIIVTGAPSAPNLGVGAAAALSPPPPKPQQADDTQSDDIVVTATPPAIPNLGTGIDLSSLGISLGGRMAIEAATKGMTEEQKKGLTASDYIRLAALGLGALGGIGGGGGSGSGTVPRFGSINPIFNQQLPQPSLAARTPTPASALPMQTKQDWYRYGYGPEQSFYSNVPQGAPNTSQAYTGYEEPYTRRFAEGGVVSDDDERRIAEREMEALRVYEGERPHRRRPHFSTQHQFGGDDYSSYSLAVPVGDRGQLFANAFGSGLVPEALIFGGSYDLGDLAVRAPYFKRFEEGGSAVDGEGDGRSDEIPALLSDGEYVMDAETVALLGNGSTKAGADALDSFRVKIRRHKGRGMARGKLSAKAKKPEQYLKEGRK